MPEEISAAGKMNFAQRIDISACWLGNGTDWMCVARLLREVGWLSRRCLLRIAACLPSWILRWTAVVRAGLLGRIGEELV